MKKFRLFEVLKEKFGEASETLLGTHVPPLPRLIAEPLDQGFVKSFDGTQIYWERHGPNKASSELGRPMVFCYGLVCSMNQWRFQLARYAEEHPCLILDYRGHHKSHSPKDSRLMNLSAIAKDVAAVIHHQKFDKPVHVWGHSMGASVAIELAVAEPLLVKSLVLCCGTLGNPFRGMLGTNLLDTLIKPILKSYGNHGDAYAAVSKALLGHPTLNRAVAQIAGFNDRASTPADMDAYAIAVANLDPRTFFPLLQEMARGSSVGIVSKVQAPALIVAGGQDYVTPPETQKVFAEKLPRASYCEIPLGSHNVQLDFGEYVCLKVEEFWKARNLC